MNIELQTAGLLITGLLLVLFISKANLKLYSQQIFLNALIMTVILLFMDVASVVAIYFEDDLPDYFVHFLGKVYIVILLYEVSIALLYIIYDALGELRHKKFTYITIGINAIESVIVMILPIKTYHKGSVVYTYGTSTNVVYIFVAIYLIAIVFLAIRFKKMIYPRRWFAFMVWIGLWIFAAIGQFMNSSLLLVGFAAAMGMIILYITLENPESYIDQKLGCFNEFALNKYLKQLFENQEPCFVYSFSFSNVGDEQEKVIKAVNSSIKNLKNTSCYKRINADFIVISEDFVENQKIISYLKRLFKEKSTGLEGLVVGYLENGMWAKNSEELENLFDYYNEDFRLNSVENINAISERMVKDFLNQKNIKEEIVEALAEDRVEVFLQPIYSLHSKRFVSAEALVRIRKKDGGLLSPGLFIPVAESTGLILDLGQVIFEKVCKFLNQYSPWQYGLEYVEVNLSVLQCEKDNLAEILMNIMKANDVEPSRINLEITETASVSAKRKLLKNMDILKKEGCTFSLDDFGKGESNLMYIVEMPVAILKLDYDMTKAYRQSEKAESVVKSVVAMAHDMGLSVVAEGIETKEELQDMDDLGIDYIQGYYFSKPLPMTEYLEFIKK